MKMPVRFAIWAWGTSVSVFQTFSLPSILQPNNIPWLVANGFPVALDFYTTTVSAGHLRSVAKPMLDALSASAEEGSFSVTFYEADAAKTTLALKVDFFRTLVHRSIETRSPTIFIFADMYYGNGSIRNLVTYGQKPGVTVGGMYLRVKQPQFAALLARHQTATGDATISNARLVDISFDSMIDAMKNTVVDNDRNSSFLTSASIREITPDLYTYTFHSPPPILCSFQPQDAQFFERFGWNSYLTDHIWPERLMAQNRWRVMSSSDFFFVAELNDPEIENLIHNFVINDGMQYNDEYVHENIHGRVHQTMLMTLRRERLPQFNRA
jgi:hypothetical protein